MNEAASRRASRPAGGLERQARSSGAWLALSSCPAAYWSGFLGFAVAERPAAEEVVLLCAPGQCRLRLRQLPAGTALDRGTA